MLKPLSVLSSVSRVVLAVVTFAALAFAAVSVAAPGCATMKPIEQKALTQAIDCLKPEIAQQLPNVIAGVNNILSQTETIQTAKDAEITSLLSGKDELIACVLRQVISDIRDVAVSAALDTRVMRMQTDAASIVKAHGYKYSDGWENLNN